MCHCSAHDRLIRTVAGSLAALLQPRLWITVDRSCSGPDSAGKCPHMTQEGLKACVGDSGDSLEVQARMKSLPKAVDQVDQHPEGLCSFPSLQVVMNRRLSALAPEVSQPTTRPLGTLWSPGLPAFQRPGRMAGGKDWSPSFVST